MTVHDFLVYHLYRYRGYLLNKANQFKGSDGPKRLIASLSVEKLSDWNVLTANKSGLRRFRKLNQASRLSAAKTAITEYEKLIKHKKKPAKEERKCDWCKREIAKTESRIIISTTYENSKDSKHWYWCTSCAHTIRDRLDNQLQQLNTYSY